MSSPCNGWTGNEGRRVSLYSVHVRTRKFRNLAETKRYVVPAPTANSKTQGGTSIDSDSICHRCHRHQSVFFGFSDGLSISNHLPYRQRRWSSDLLPRGR